MSEQEAAPAAVTPETPVVTAPTAPTPAESGTAPAQKVAGEAPATPEGSEKKPDTPDAAEKPGKSRFERRIDRAYRRAAEAQARAEFYEKQLAEMKQKTEPADPHAPQLHQFKDIEEYAQAKAKYESEKVLTEHRAKEQAEVQKQNQKRLATEWEERVSRAEDKYEDFHDVVGEITPTTPLGIAIMRAENGEDVAYHLGQNLKEAQRIAELDPYSQVLEIGRLSQRLAAEPVKPKQPSKAPAPIETLKGVSQADPTTPSDKDDIKDWIKKRQRQVHGVRAR